MTRTAPRPLGAGPRAEKGQISTFQFSMMLIAVIVSSASAFVPSLLLQMAKQDSWLSVAGAWSLDVALGVVYAYMGLRFPGETFVEYAGSSLGPWLGRPIGFMFPAFFFFVSCVLLDGLSTLITTLFLHGTPTWFAAGAALVVVSYGARAGLEVVARAAEYLAPIFIVSTFVVVGAVLPSAQMEYLSPMFEHGLKPALQGVPLALSFLGVCVIMGMFQAYQNEPHRAWFAKFSAVTTGSLMVIAVLITAVGLFGPEAAGSTRYPDLEIARLVSAGDFVERIEAIWMVIAVGAAVLSLAILLWATAVGIAQTFGLKEYRPLVLPVAGLLLPVSLMMFAGQVNEAAFIRSIFPFYALTVEAGLEVLIWLAALVRGKRGQGQRPGRVQEPERPIQ